MPKGIDHDFEQYNGRDMEDSHWMKLIVFGTPEAYLNKLNDINSYKHKDNRKSYTYEEIRK